jgi:stage III sporulation protein SpoIIIAA
VLDLGRRPTARYINEEIFLTEQEVTRLELEGVAASIGSFDADNRAGMERTLHRISAIRNRRGEIVGLTCRVGRAVYGTIEIIKDLIESGQSILMMGPPGVGKTTMLREAARVLAESKRVVIVDTSNEIGGDGDVPHPAVGRARRMQVSHPERQHEVMIEAVENHNPEVIVIDEIGRELEAQAARTIAERGVQLIGTAHGNALENLMLNPTLSDLVGGIQAVTLSDEEARRRGTQKTVLERRSPPTFDVLVELHTRDRMIIHEDVAAAVDFILRERSLTVELRYRDAEGDMHVESVTNKPRPLIERNERGRGEGGRTNGYDDRPHGSRRNEVREDSDFEPPLRVLNAPSGATVKVYPYGVARNRLSQAGRRLRVPMVIVDEPGQADVILTLKNYYRRRPKMIVDAERAGKGIYVMRANTVSQMDHFLMDMFQKDEEDGVTPTDPFGGAMREVREAIMLVRGGKAYIDLAPQSQLIRRRQHEMARRAHLDSQSYGSEPERYVRVAQREA